MWGEETMRAIMREKATWAVIGCFLAAFVLYLFFQGTLSRGAARYEIHRTTGGFGRSTVGWSLGTKTLYLREGQVFDVHYDVNIKTGMLHVHLFNQYAEFGKGTVGSHYARANGKGCFTFRIPETGLYALVIDASPDGHGYDLEYSASWGVRSSSN